MGVKLENLDPKFRQITDLLLFSDNRNLEFDNFISLLKANYSAHLEYFLNRFIKSCDIFWENNEELWNYRLNILLSFKDKNISNKTCAFLEKRMVALTRRKFSISPKYDIEFLQYLALCQVKKARNESLDFAKSFLEELPSHFRIDKTIETVNYFIPIVYASINEYAENISKKIANSTKNFIILKGLEKLGVPYSREWLISLANSIITERINSDKNRRLFFALLDDPEIMNGMKEKYSSLHKNKILSLLNHCDYSLLESLHLKNIKNLIKLDTTITDKIVEIYINKLYSRQFSHKRSNADRLIRLIKDVPEVSAKIVFSCLSTKNKMGDIKYMLPHFPEIKNLSVFL